MMKRISLRVFFPTFILTLLAGCSSTPGPAELVKFNPSIKLNELWSVSVGSAKNYVFQPVVVNESV